MFSALQKLRTLIFFKVRLYRSFQITLKKIEKTNLHGSLYFSCFKDYY